MVSSALLQEWIGVEAVADQALVLDAADRALAWVETQTGRYFHEPAEFVLRFDGGGKTIWLPEIPASETVESDTVDILTVEVRIGTEWEEKSADDDYELIRGPYLWEMPRLVYKPLSACYVWPSGYQNVRATYSAGYEPGFLPGDIEQLIVDMVATWYRDRGSENLRSETIDGYSYTRWMPTSEAGISEAWKSTLEKWRHQVYA